MEQKHSFIIYVKRSGKCTNCNVPYSWTETSDELIDFQDKNQADRITIEALYKTFCKKCYYEKFRPLKKEDTYSDRCSENCSSGCSDCGNNYSESSNSDSDDSEDQSWKFSDVLQRCTQYDTEKNRFE